MAQIQSLAWEHPYAAGVVIKKKEREREKEKRRQIQTVLISMGPKNFSLIIKVIL